MRLYIFIFSMILLINSCDLFKDKKPTINKDGLNNTALINHPTDITFKDTLLDLGVLKEGDVKSVEFEFTNAGTSDLVLYNVQGSCGCTVTEYPKEIFKAGKSGKIKATFNSAKRPGDHRKSISINSNTLPPTHQLFFKVSVKP
jgi:hypothetical protein